MGGHYSARSGLAGEVEAAIVLGGPVEAAFNRDASLLQFGMDGIVGYAWGSISAPAPRNWPRPSGAFSLRPRLDQDINAPMPVRSTAPTTYTSPSTTRWCSKARRDTEVHLIPDTGHCATTKFPEAIGLMFSWLQPTLESLGVKADS